MVPHFEPIPTDSPVAVGLLDAYFTSRELGFATHTGGYRRSHPEPAAFTPPRGVLLVVLDDANAAVGCGGVRRIENLDGLPTFEVKHLWIDEHARGRGWSRLLLEELEAHARRFGAQQLVLDTNETLAVAQHLYRTSGYEQIPAYNENSNATHWFRKRPVDGNPESAQHLGQAG